MSRNSPSTILVSKNKSNREISYDPTDFIYKIKPDFTGQKQYTKNIILEGILGNFFSMYYTSDESDDFTMAHSRSSHTDLPGLDYQINVQYRPVWLADNASWRSMYVSQLPITRLHWHR